VKESAPPVIDGVAADPEVVVSAALSARTISVRWVWMRQERVVAAA
jgi:hypothetical protein